MNIKQGMTNNDRGGIPTKLEEPSPKYTEEKEGKSRHKDQDSTLFVGDLPLNCLRSDLESLFDSFGNIEDIQIKMVRTMKQSFAYAFVRFENRESASMVLNCENQFFLGSYKLRIGWAFRNKSLHVGNIDILATESDLRSLFESYGELENKDGIILFRKDVPGYTNYAHVNFCERSAASTARTELNQYEFYGRLLRVEWNRSPKKFTDAIVPVSSTIASESSIHSNLMVPVNDRGTYKLDPVLSVYVQFETIVPGQRVTEETLRNVFESFGSVIGCFIKSNYLSSDGSRQYGYGFVHFESSVEGEECAKRAVNALSSYVFNGVAYRCEFSRNFKRATGVLVEETSESQHPINHELSHGFTDYNNNSQMLSSQMSESLSSMNGMQNQPQIAYYYYFSTGVPNSFPLPMNEQGYYPYPEFPGAVSFEFPYQPPYIPNNGNQLNRQNTINHSAAQNVAQLYPVSTTSSSIPEAAFPTMVASTPYYSEEDIQQ